MSVEGGIRTHGALRLDELCDVQIDAVGETGRAQGERGSRGHTCSMIYIALLNALHGEITATPSRSGGRG